jgi:hypothetical protein
MLNENEQQTPTLKQRLYGFVQGVGLGAPMTFFSNYVLVKIPYIGPFFQAMPPLAVNMLSVAGGSANTQWLAEPAPIALPKNTYGKVAVALSTTLAAGALAGYGFQTIYDKANYNPDPALAATLQSAVGGAAAYGLRALVPPICSIGKKGYAHVAACLADCQREDDAEESPINEDNNDENPNATLLSLT